MNSRTSRTDRRRRIGAASIAALVVGAGVVGSSGTAAAAVPVRAGLADIPTAAPCDAGYTDLALTPEDDAEAWLASSLRACARTNGTGVDYEVINAGPAIWVIDGAQWRPDSIDGRVDAVGLFRFLTRGTYQGMALEPGEKATVSAGPDHVVRMELNLALQSQWEVINRGVDAANEKAKSAIKAKSPTGYAIMQCGLAAVAAGNTISSSNLDDSAGVLDATFGVAKAAEPCRRSLLELPTRERRPAAALPAVEDFSAAAIRNAPKAEQEGGVLITALRKAGPWVGRLLR
jgi:hypothetical protein